MKHFPFTNYHLPINSYLIFSKIFRNLLMANDKWLKVKGSEEALL
jgi:hypothetical protein